MWPADVGGFVVEGDVEGVAAILEASWWRIGSTGWWCHFRWGRDQGRGWNFWWGHGRRRPASNHQWWRRGWGCVRRGEEAELDVKSVSVSKPKPCSRFRNRNQNQVAGSESEPESATVDRTGTKTCRFRIEPYPFTSLPYIGNIYEVKTWVVQPLVSRQ